MRARYRASWLVLGVFLEVGCGCKQTYIEPDLQSYVSDFLNLSEAERVSESINGLGLTVVFGNAPAVTGLANTVGVCQVGNFSRTVTIDTNAWDRLGDMQRRMVVYHELGHCVLNRVHRNDAILNTACPQSMMNAYVLPEQCLKQYYSQYNYELFHSDAMITEPTQDSSTFYVPRTLTKLWRVD